MSYKHGIYGAVAATNSPTVRSQGTVPVYIGSLPVHRQSNADELVNTPIVISSLREAQEKHFYSDDWKTFTLCEAIHAHFMNGSQAVAPIILVNVVNPSESSKTDATAHTFTLKKSGAKLVGRVKIPNAFLDNTTAVTVSGKAVTGATYSYDGDYVVVEATPEGNTASAEASITCKVVEFAASDVAAEDITKALTSLDYCEQLTGYVPNIVAAPALSAIPALHDLIVAKVVEKLAGKWNAICVSDIPDTVTTYEAAITWKSNNGYDSKYDKVFFPKLAHGDKVYHASTIGAYMMQYTDCQNADVPYISISNKPIFCDRAVIGADAKTLLISEIEANKLNEVGITTVNIIKRGLRLWGAHMANYNHSAIDNIAVEDRFDASVRMTAFILNYLQNQYINEIDESFTQKDVDSVVNGVQTWLDSLVNDGMLLYASVSFNNESNGEATLANGDFIFDMEVTYTVIAKSITFKLQYTDTGVVSLTTEEGSEE